MALGRSGIASARAELAHIGAKVAEARSNNERFINMYSDPNFQTFVADTNRGAMINGYLKNLSSWFEKMCETVDAMEAQTQAYLSNQEMTNK